MSFRKTLFFIEAAIFENPPFRWLVLAIDVLVRRAFWVWGRIRFAAQLPQRGKNCICHWTADIKYPKNITLGDGVIIGVNATLGAHSAITLGDNVRISKDVIIETAGLIFTQGPPPYAHRSAPIVIDNGVWIGTRAIILSGVTIGENAVIAAGSIVSKSIPANVIAAGSPAKPIKKLHSQAET